MVREFDKVMEEFQKLPAETQRVLSKEWLDEIKWTNRFVTSQDSIASLAKEALEEHSAGLTQDMK